MSLPRNEMGLKDLRSLKILHPAGPWPVLCDPAQPQPLPAVPNKSELQESPNHPAELSCDPTGSQRSQWHSSRARRFGRSPSHWFGWQDTGTDLGKAGLLCPSAPHRFEERPLLPRCCKKQLEKHLGSLAGQGSMAKGRSAAVNNRVMCTSTGRELGIHPEGAEIPLLPELPAWEQLGELSVTAGDRGGPQLWPSV